jgi:hypothetical protein
MTQTPDGVRFDDPAVNVIQLNSDVFDFWLIFKTHTLPNTLMRYVPSSSYTFDEIVQQCYDAINRIPTMSTPNDDSFYNELLQFEEYRELIAAWVRYSQRNEMRLYKGLEISDR